MTHAFKVECRGCQKQGMAPAMTGDVGLNWLQAPDGWDLARHTAGTGPRVSFFCPDCRGGGRKKKAAKRAAKQ